MIGGVDNFNFNVSSEDLKTTMSHYERYTSPFRQKYIGYMPEGTNEVKYGFEKVELVAYGFALVTKLGSMFSGNNRKEQISVFACYKTNIDPNLFCYAIVRCAKTLCNDRSTTNRIKANYNMEDKILFLFISTNGNVNTLSSNLVQMRDEIVKGTTYNVFQFTNRLLDDDDIYKILVESDISQIVDPRANKLIPFFQSVSKTDRDGNSKDSVYYTESTSYPLDISFVRETLNLDQRDRDGSTGLGITPFLVT